MSTTNTLTNIDDLGWLFFDAAQPFWRIYGGRSASKGTTALYTNKEITNLEDSFAKLEHILSMYGDGQYLIETREAKATSSYTQKILFKAGSFKTAHPPQGMAGIGGFNNIVEYQRFMDEQVSGTTHASIEAEREKWRLEMQILEQKRELKELKKASTTDRVLEAALGKLPQILDRFLAPTPTAAPSQVGTLSSDKDIEESVLEFTEADNQKLSTQLGEIADLFPDKHPLDVIQKLIELAKAQPEMAKSILG